MTGSPTNTLWARSVIDELARSGVREVVVAPGSRSTPLVLACAAADRLRVRVHLDERSAAFFALGVGKATGRPAAVVTTSGTAVANVFPAVVEASQAGVPLLVLSADRPHRLRDSDANQAIDQVSIFGRYPRAFFDLGLPTMDGPSLRHLRAVAGRAYAATVAPDAGPVHLNFPFDKPLEAAEPPEAFLLEHALASTGRASGAPFTAIRVVRPTASESVLDDVQALLTVGHGVVVAGPSEDAERLGPAVARLAAELGWPVLADPLSGARYGPSGGAHVVAAYDLFLRDADVRARLAPGVILRVGASPTSASLQSWLLDHNGVTHVVVDDAGRWKDHGATATDYVRADPADTLHRLADRVAHGSGHVVDDAWGHLWRAADAAARAGIPEAEGEAVHEGHIAAAVLAALPAGASLFVSSSMPIRDLDAFGHPGEKVVHVRANRGASGIDGIVSTAFGVASQTEAPTVCVLGDVAFFHDRNGLLWSREPDCPVVFVLVDNDGGGIFHMLPVAEHDPPFTRLFATPHGVDAIHAARAHDVELTEVGPGDVGGAVARAIATSRSVIVRVRTVRTENRRLHEEARQAVGRSVTKALG